LNFKKNKII